MLLDKIIQNEGSLEYQTVLGSFRAGRFWKYMCSEGVETIGYGHALRASESFSKGLSEAEAMILLRDDLKHAVRGARSLHVDERQEVNDVLTEMVYQLGLNGVRKFKKMLAALKVGDYQEAAKQMKDSKWYKQTPNRVGRHVEVMENILCGQV